MAASGSTDSGIAHGSTRRDSQIHSSKRGKNSSDGLSQIFRLRFRLGQTRFQQFAGLLLHRTPIAGGAQPQPPLGTLGQFADNYASHVINDSIGMLALQSLIAMQIPWAGNGLVIFDEIIYFDEMVRVQVFDLRNEEENRMRVS